MAKQTEGDDLDGRQGKSCTIIQALKCLYVPSMAMEFRERGSPGASKEGWIYLVSIFDRATMYLNGRSGVEWFLCYAFR